jgi:hypothetical protein
MRSQVKPPRREPRTLAGASLCLALLPCGTAAAAPAAPVRQRDVVLATSQLGYRPGR